MFVLAKGCGNVKAINAISVKTVSSRFACNNGEWRRRLRLVETVFVNANDVCQQCFPTQAVYKITTRNWSADENPERDVLYLWRPRTRTTNTNNSSILRNRILSKAWSVPGDVHRIDLEYEKYNMKP